MIGLYAMIIVATWYYPGQESTRVLLRCYSVLDPSGDGAAEGHGEESAEATELAVRMAVTAARRVLQ